MRGNVVVCLEVKYKTIGHDVVMMWDYIILTSANPGPHFSPDSNTTTRYSTQTLPSTLVCNRFIFLWQIQLRPQHVRRPHIQPML